MTASNAQWIEQLSSDEAAIRATAAEALCHLGEGARCAAVELIGVCDDQCESVREWAAASLEGMGAPEAGQSQALLEIATAASDDRAFWAITLLGRLGQQCCGTAVADCLRGLSKNHSSESVRRRAIWALERVSPDAR